MGGDNQPGGGTSREVASLKFPTVFAPEEEGVEKGMPVN